MSSATKEKQRQEILSSARSILMTEPKIKLRANEVAKQANIARTSLYEHFTSMNDLMGELLLLELMDFRLEVRRELSEVGSVNDIIEKWIGLNLSYFADGRHGLVRALMPSALNSNLKDEIRASHIMLYDELRVSLEKSGYELSPLRFEFITAVLETAAKKMESSSKELVRQETQTFIARALA